MKVKRWASAGNAPDTLIYMVVSHIPDLRNEIMGSPEWRYEPSLDVKLLTNETALVYL